MLIDAIFRRHCKKLIIGLIVLYLYITLTFFGVFENINHTQGSTSDEPVVTNANVADISEQGNKNPDGIGSVLESRQSATAMGKRKNSEVAFDDKFPIVEEPVIEKIDFNDSIRKMRLITLEEIYKVPRVPDDVYKLGETLSRTIDLDRPPNDLRPDRCKSIIYNISNLPTISIVIPIYNEALSMVLRTVHSAINHTPQKLLADVILVDDQSKYDNLKEPLDKYLKYLPSKVKVLRNDKRQGLIRARMRGAEIAKGDILMFQDAHTEFSPGWSEPILEYIRIYPNTVVQPTIEELHVSNITWPDSVAQGMSRGVFMWDMRFAWNVVPQKYSVWQLSEIDPYPNPILVGCSIAVSKKYFFELGGFDSGLNIWGGENIELSLRTWMCGGQMVILPCSRIAHVFKPFSYSFDGDKERIVGKNSIRVVETWMDEFRDYYYASNFVYPFKRVELSKEEKESLRQHKLLREKLKCKSFRWYLENVLPEMATPGKNVRFFGEIQNVKSSFCFQEDSDGWITLTRDCYTYSRLRPEEEYGITLEGQLMHDGKCVAVQENLLLRTEICGTNKAAENGWSFDVLPDIAMQIGTLRFTNQNRQTRCLQQITNINQVHYMEQMPQLLDCNSNEWQTWYITYNLDYSLVPPSPV